MVTPGLPFSWYNPRNHRQSAVNQDRITIRGHDSNFSTRQEPSTDAEGSSSSIPDNRASTSTVNQDRIIRDSTTSWQQEDSTYQEDSHSSLVDQSHYDAFYLEDMVKQLPEIEPDRQSQASEMTANLQCITCNRQIENAVGCDGCGYARYCFVACKQEDLALHKLICERFKALVETLPHPPPQTHRIVIVLGEEDIKPRVMWVTFKQGFGALDGKWVPDFTFLGDYHRVRAPYTVSGNLNAINADKVRFMRAHFDHNVVMYGTEVSDPAERQNACINVLMNKRAPAYWKGPYMIVSQQRELYDPVPFNATFSDFRLAVDFLRTYDCLGRNEAFDAEFITRGLYTRSLTVSQILNSGRSPTFVNAVIISCLGDQVKFSLPHYSPYRIHADHPIFRLNPTKITSYMDSPHTPMVTYSLPHDTLWCDDTESTIGYNPFENDAAAFLHLDCSSVDRLWGHSNFRGWDTKIGSVLVVRKDGSDLSVAVVEGLAEYCRLVVYPAMRDQLELEGVEEEALGRVLSPVEKRNERKPVVDSVLGVRCPYRAFFAQMRVDMVNEGRAEWVGASLPA